MKGEVGKRAEEARLFAARLRESFSLPVTLWDERLTSVRAHQSMREMGMKKKQRAEKSSVDQIAAALLLQNYLDAARIRSQREALKRSGEGTDL
jgi:putative Holliday junction resolvase